MQIYKITNKKSNKSYIGKEEKNKINYYGSGIYINRAIKKYGKDNFIKEILQECSSKDELNDAERFWIKKENTLVPNGYNLTLGGDGGSMLGKKHSKSTIKKMKSTQTKRFQDKNERIKISISRKGWVPSQKTRHNMSIAQINNKNAKNSIRTKENREKISYTLKSKTKYFNKNFILSNNKNESFIISYLNFKDFCKKNELTSSTLLKVLNKEGRSQHKGWRIEYVD